MQVKQTIQNGRITYVQFLQYPNDRQTSIEINQQAIPILNLKQFKHKVRR